jgi:hypothetical protein
MIINSERLLVLDYNIEAIDFSHADKLANERSALDSAHLSMITGFGISKPIYEKRYALIKDNGEFRHERVSTQPWDLSRISSMPKKGKICPAGVFNGTVFKAMRYANESFECPIETRKILRGRNQADPATRHAFDKCSLLYQLALTIGRHHPTVQISYLYAAVNAVTQELGSEYKGFSDFVQKHYTGRLGDFLDYMHKVRSSHWHGGEFLMGETDYRDDYLTNPVRHVRSHNFEKAYEIIRTSIFNWVMNKVAANAD